MALSKQAPDVSSQGLEQKYTEYSQLPDELLNLHVCQGYARTCCSQRMWIRTIPYLVLWACWVRLNQTPVGRVAFLASMLTNSSVP